MTTLTAYLKRAAKLSIAVCGVAVTLAAHASSVKLSEPAPDFTLKTLNGPNLRLEEYRGQVVLINFWASWCGPCRDEMPAIQNMINSLRKEGLKIAMINTAEDEDTVFSFLSAYAPDIRPLMDQDGQATEKWQPRGLPATYLVDPAGLVRYQALGGRSWDTPAYINFLRSLINSN